MMFDAQECVCLRRTAGCARQGSWVAPAFARFGACRSNFLAELRIHDDSAVHITVHAPFAQPFRRRPPSQSHHIHPTQRQNGAKAAGSGRAVGHASPSAPAPQAPRAPSEQARDEPMPGRNVLSVGYVRSCSRERPSLIAKQQKSGR